MSELVDRVVPPPLARELLRLARKNRAWVRWEWHGEGVYQARAVEPTSLTRIWHSGSDAFGMWALSIWLHDGPKVFRPAREQCEDMAQIEVRIALGDYAQPYPALLVELPAGTCAPFTSVLCHHADDILTCSLFSDDHLDDIVTTIAVDGRPIEASLFTYDTDCAALGPIAGRSLRIAINACLCLMTFGCRRNPEHPARVESDRRLAREQSERGQRARDRLRQAVSVVTFAQDVKLRQSEHNSDDCGNAEPTGREHRPHWRRGHWAMLACGRGRTERRRVLRKPCLVRADRFVGDASDTTTTYHK